MHLVQVTACVLMADDNSSSSAVLVASEGYSNALRLFNSMITLLEWQEAISSYSHDQLACKQAAADLRYIWTFFLGGDSFLQMAPFCLYHSLLFTSVIILLFRINWNKSTRQSGLLLSRYFQISSADHHLLLKAYAKSCLWFIAIYSHSLWQWAIKFILYL